LSEVIVIWSNAKNLKDGLVNTLNGHTGVRVYEKDKVDSRIMMSEEQLPFFSEMQSAIDYMKENADKPVQLCIKTARKFDLL